MKASPSSSPPADGLAALRAHWTSDFLSGFTLFLIALPLSIGIAMASGAPPTAGLLAAIVGGVLGSLLGGSHLTINGPAAGLIVIVAGAIADLGHGDPQMGFRRALAAFVVAGALQMLFAVLRLGVLGLAVPKSVIHGMLSAIGIIIVAKQIPIALGVTAAPKEALALLASIPDSIRAMNPEVALIAAVSFIVLLSYKQIRGHWTKYVPAPLVVVLVGAALARLFDFEHSHLVTSDRMQFEVGPTLLLNLPDRLSSAFIFPDWSEVLTPTSLRWSVSLALVASIESLLSASAVDGMDPYRRVSDLDRELFSKGICNIVCGLIGGLPIIAEIVRSSANVRNGGVTRWANFFHGMLLLVFLALFPQVLRQIPLAALAALLISVGISLAHPSQLLHVAAVGWEQLVTFLTTLVLTVATDLLLGVAAGILLKLAFNVARGASLGGLFRACIETERDGNRSTLRASGPLVFTNLASFRKHLKATASDASVFLDLTATTVVDHTVLDQLHRFQQEAQARGREFAFSFSERHRAVSKHPLAARRRRGKD
jgi:MFS superfamily sulfate permease-like transporter